VARWYIPGSVTRWYLPGMTQRDWSVDRKYVYWKRRIVFYRNDP
jgi:hypothetical protein